ncbi:hypothetical protein IJ541_01685 [bacterium]|nr:hypothetical protein [bacterium]
MNKIYAFTLAETLITIGIIGIVAALTIPNLMHKYYEKQTVAKLKETYSILSQAIKMSEEEFGSVANWEAKFDSDGANLIAERLKPFLKIANDCGLVDEKEKCIVKQVYKLKNNNDHDMDYNSNNGYYKMNLFNGSSIILRGKMSSNPENLIGIFIDTNGKTKPNKVGTDLFQFYYYEDLGLKPAGAPNTQFDYNTTCIPQTAQGFGCAYYVMNSGKMDYLWH